MPPKQNHWKIKDAEWYEETKLWIKNEELAERVFRTAWVDEDLKLVLDSTVVTGSGNCDGTRTGYGPKTELEWDDAGCLIVHDQDLIALIEQAKANYAFQIVVDNAIARSVLGLPPTKNRGSGIGELKVNAQCTC